MLKSAQPQVLILPAGLAVEDLKAVKSLESVVVVDISTDPHMDWSNEEDGVSTKSWDEVLNISEHYEPTEPAEIAVQSFISLRNGLKSVEFTQQVLRF
jgi:hypothetical protein